MATIRTFEDQLSLRFAPTYISSDGEDRYLVELERKLTPKISLGYPPWKPCIYYSISKNSLRAGQGFYEIDYLSIWDKDTGGPIGPLSTHIWDTERTAILVKGPAESMDAYSFEAEEAYYARPRRGDFQLQYLSTSVHIKNPHTKIEV